MWIKKEIYGKKIKGRNPEWLLQKTANMHDIKRRSHAELKEFQVFPTIPKSVADIRDQFLMFFLLLLTRQRQQLLENDSITENMARTLSKNIRTSYKLKTI